MVVIGINYAVEPFGLALIQNGHCLRSFLFKSTYTSTENIGETIQSMLSVCGLSLKDVSGIGLCSGPGQYTSLRVSVSVVKTLSQFLNCPIVPFETLTALYLPFRFMTDTVCSVIPARKGELNIQFFGSTDHEFQAYSSCLTCTYQEFDVLLRRFEKSIHVVGIFPEEYKLCDNTSNITWSKCRIDPVLIAEETCVALEKNQGKTYRDFSIYYSHQPV